MIQYFIFSTNIEFIDFVEMHLINKLGVGKENVHDLIDMEEDKSLVVTTEDLIISDDEHQNDTFPKCQKVFKMAFIEALVIKDKDYEDLNDFVKKQKS